MSITGQQSSRTDTEKGIVEDREVNDTVKTSATRPIVAIGAAFIIVASVVAMDPSGWFPFGTSKWHAVLLAIVVATWAAATRASGSGLGAPRWFVAAWAALLVVLLVAAIFGREPVYAWIGTPERRLGWLTWGLFALCCWIGTRLASACDRRMVARVASLAMGFVGVYSVIELTLGAPIQVDTVGVRIGGPYGSSAFLGATLCLLIPVSIAQALDHAERRSWRWVGGAAAALGIIALIGSATRAAFFGIGIAIVVVAVAALRQRRPIRIGSRRTLVVVVAAIAAILVVSATASMLGSPTADRLAGNVGRVADVSASSRLDEWRVGIRIVAAHPVLGVGPEGYRTALADGITADYERAYGRDVIPDRAHNGIIDVAAAGGVIAGVLYGVLLGGVALAAWRRLRGVGRGGDQRAAAATGRAPIDGIAVAVIAYAAQQVFLFPVSVIDPIFWLFVGMVVATPRAVGARPAPTPSRRSARLIAVTGSVAVIGVTLSAVLDISADRLAAQAAKATPGASAPALAARAATLRPDVLRYHMLDDRLQPMTVTGIDTAIATLDDAASVSPLDPVVRRRHAERLLDRAIATGGPDDKQAAIAAWSDLARDTNCYRCHLGLGYAYALSGDTEQAIPAFQRAAQLARVGDNEAADAAAALTALRVPADTSPQD